MKEKWEVLYDIDFIARRLQSIRDNIIHNLYYEIDNNTGFAKINTDTNEPILSGISKKECTRIANGRISQIKKALKFLYKKHSSSIQFNYLDDIAYYNYNSGAYFFYHYRIIEDKKQIKNILAVFDLYSNGVPIDTLYPELNNSNINESFINNKILEYLIKSRF